MKSESNKQVDRRHCETLAHLNSFIHDSLVQIEDAITAPPPSDGAPYSSDNWGKETNLSKIFKLISVLVRTIPLERQVRGLESGTYIPPMDDEVNELYGNHLLTKEVMDSINRHADQRTEQAGEPEQPGEPEESKTE